MCTRGTEALESRRQRLSHSFVVGKQGTKDAGYCNGNQEDTIIRAHLVEIWPCCVAALLLECLRPLPHRAALLRKCLRRGLTWFRAPLTISVCVPVKTSWLLKCLARAFTRSSAPHLFFPPPTPTAHPRLDSFTSGSKAGKTHLGPSPAKGANLTQRRHPHPGGGSCVGP